MNESSQPNRKAHAVGRRARFGPRAMPDMRSTTPPVPKSACSAWILAMMAPLSAGAQVVNNPQHAIGTHLEIAAGDYATIDHTQHVLNADRKSVV